MWAEGEGTSRKRVHFAPMTAEQQADFDRWVQTVQYHSEADKLSAQSQVAGLIASGAYTWSTDTTWRPNHWCPGFWRCYMC